MRYHWGLGIGHKYSWKGPQGEAFHHPRFSSSHLTSLEGFRSETRYWHEQAQSDTPRSPQQVGKTFGTLDGSSNGNEEVLENIPSDDELQLEGEIFNDSDGMEDRENEDLGDDSDESDCGWNGMGYDMYDD